MNDKELLELAAKAFFPDCANLTYPLDWVQNCHGDWNPLADDGDAHRLSVKLAFCVSHWTEHTPPDVMVGYRLSAGSGANQIEDYGQDPYAATRRAIVRAAAEIGKLK
jgi:hypothetical protein